MKNISIEKWNNYKKNELNKISSVLHDLGFSLHTQQVHISGERHLMSGYKLVLIGKNNKDDKKVVIKISSKENGKKEIAHDHKARVSIRKIDFAYKAFHLPEEVLFTEYDGFTISITEYIEEPRSFFEHSSIEQFFLMLRAFETQEGAQITTFSHRQIVSKTFGILTADDYTKNSLDFCKSIKYILKDATEYDTFESSLKFIEENKSTIEQYCDFLTHSDFVPHNLRIVGSDIFLLDHTSIHFGNKYESWARFMNYMVIYNPTLEIYLKKYIVNNRGYDEYLSLRLMRVYKLMFLINYYATSLANTENDLQILTKKRISFWILILKNILEDKEHDSTLVEDYKNNRDALRSKDEIKRQKNLKQL